MLVDSDGVCSDFVAAACRAHGREFDPDAWPPGEYDVAKVLGTTEDRFWRGIDRRGAAFWRELDEYPWFTRLHAELSRIGRIYFVSAPNHSSASAAGKVLWLQDRFGEGFQDFVLTREKHLLSRKGAVLIDDCDAVIEAFDKGEGRGVLFPQVWNRNHWLAGADRVEYVLDQIFNYLAELGYER